MVSFLFYSERVMEPLVAEYFFLVVNREGSKVAGIVNGCDCIFVCKLCSHMVSLTKSENVFSNVSVPMQSFIFHRETYDLLWNLDSAFGRDARDENDFDPRFNRYNIYFSDDVTYDSRQQRASRSSYVRY